MPRNGRRQPPYDQRHRNCENGRAHGATAAKICLCGKVWVPTRDDGRWCRCGWMLVGRIA